MSDYLDHEDLVRSNFRRLRDAYGISQDVLATAMAGADLGWKRSTVCDYETGRRGLHINELVYLCGYYDVEVGAIISCECNPVVSTEGVHLTWS